MLFGIRPIRLDATNIEKAAEEIRNTFRGEVLEVYEVGFEGTSLIHNNLYFDTSDELGGVWAKLGNISHRLMLVMKDEREGYSIRFETADWVTLQWVGPNALILRNDQRPIHDSKTPVRELYITVLRP